MHIQPFPNQANPQKNSLEKCFSTVIIVLILSGTRNDAYLKIVKPRGEFLSAVYDDEGKKIFRHFHFEIVVVCIPQELY